MTTNQKNLMYLFACFLIIFSVYRVAQSIILANELRSFSYHYEQGECLLSLHLFPDAISHFKQALEIKPDSYPTHALLGDALYEAGHLSEAEAEYRLVLKHASYPSSYYNLGSILRSSGRINESDVMLHRTIEVDGSGVWAKKAQTLLDAK